VLRSSVLLDERRAAIRHSKLVSPIPWTDVMFLFSNPQDVTNDPFFSNNLLFNLLKKNAHRNRGCIRLANELTTRPNL
jgi:hypothetical protein